MNLDSEAFGRRMAVLVKDHLARALEPLNRRIAELEARPAPAAVVAGLIDQDGNLQLTLSDGTLRNAGRVVGADGTDGIPFDRFTVTLEDDERTLMVAGEIGTRRVEWPLPLSHVLDRGVWEEMRTYRKGDGVTEAGSFFIAQADAPPGRPGTAESGWRLAVKRGKDSGNG
jgi:hypothetical protein